MTNFINPQIKALHEAKLRGTRLAEETAVALKEHLTNSAEFTTTVEKILRDQHNKIEGLRNNVDYASSHLRSVYKKLNLLVYISASAVTLALGALAGLLLF